MKLFTTTSTSTRKRTRNKGLIEAGTPMPVRIISSEEGNVTKLGTLTLKYSFQHLVSLEEFASTVFENSAPEYISEKIVDAVIPPDMGYSLADLIGKGLMITVFFNKTANGTFINVVKAEPLKSEFQQRLLDLQEIDERERLEIQTGVEGVERMFDSEVDEEDELEIDLDEDTYESSIDDDDDFEEFE